MKIPFFLQTIGVAALMALQVGHAQKIDSSEIEIDFETTLVLPQMDTLQRLKPLVGFLQSIPDSSLWDQYLSPLDVDFWRVSSWDFDYLIPLLERFPKLHLQLVLQGQFPRTTYYESEEIPFQDYSGWLQRVYELVDRIPLRYHDRISIDVYNEANAERKWPNTKENFQIFFCETVSSLNARYPTLKTAGPSMGGEECYNLVHDLMRYMIQWKVSNPSKPLKLDQLTIHALGQSPRKSIQDIEKYHALISTYSLDKQLSINHLVYNEYGTRVQMLHFADAIRMLQAFEKNGIKYAARACWGTCKDGSLDDLLDYSMNEVRPKENWYGYKYYSMLKGKRFRVKTANGIAVIAGTTDDKNRMGFIANYSESTHRVTLNVKNIGSFHIYLIEDSGLREINPTFQYMLKEKQVILLSENEL